MVAGLLCLTSGVAQTRLDLQKQSRNIDFSSAITTKPFRMSTALPAVCNTGEAVFLANVNNQGLYICVAPNSWMANGNTSVVPATQPGDLIYNSGGSLVRLPVGLPGQCLTVSAGVPGWGSCATGSQTPHVIGMVFGVKDGPVLAPGTTAYVPHIPWTCNISRWDVAADAGVITFDVWMTQSTTGVPTAANSITGSAPPALTANTVAGSSVLTGWATAVNAGNTLAFSISSVSTATTAYVGLTCQ